MYFLFQKFDEKNLNKYQDVILNRVDNSQNIFEEFLQTYETTAKNTLQTIEDTFISNGENIFLGFIIYNCV